MPEINALPLQSETIEAEVIPVSMSGDSIIEHPDVAWDTPIVVPRAIDEVWAGRFGITRMGAVGDGYAGLLFPARFDPVLPEGLKSLPFGSPDPKRLEVGATIPDGHKDDKSTVVQLDDEAKTIVFETQWVPQDGKKGLHYTWQVSVTEGDEPNTTKLVARTRMENVKHPKIGSLVYPRIDQFAMRVIGEGLVRDDSAPVPKERLRRRIGTRAITAAGAVKARRASRHNKA